MAKSNRVIPEFMAENPDDTFRIIMPLNLEIDFENYGNSHFNVIVRNITKKEDFLFEMSPELLFTHYPVEKYFINGKLDKNSINPNIYEDTFLINTNISSQESAIKISEILPEKNIVSLLGWKRDFIGKAENIYCCLIKQDDITIIIPHYAIAIYYYYRFTQLREAVLNCNLGDLSAGCICDKNNASILLSEPRTDIDAAFIHRFNCQEEAKKGFEDIGRFINNYLRYMKDNHPKEKVEHLPIKAIFPVKGEFEINARVSKLINENTNETYHFIYEILGDTSDIGFNKFTKKIHRKTVSTEINNLEDLAKVQREIPGATTQILKRVNATKEYTQNKVTKNRKKSCSSLDNVEVETNNLTDEETIQIFKIYEDSLSNEAVDQSLTDSQTSGEKTVRKTVVSSSFEEKKKEIMPKEYVHNFDEFNQYMSHLEKTQMVENFCLYGVQELDKVVDKDTEKPNKKCIIKGRARQYITCTFKYNNLYAGLLELENGTNASSSTWVIVSTSIINKNVFDEFLFHYLNDNYSISAIKDLYNEDTNLRFSKKNHTKNDNLQEDDKILWLGGLLGKININ